MAKRHTNRIGDLESLFIRLEELVLANSGEDEFEEVFKLLLAKLWDEKHGNESFRAFDSDKKTFEAVSELLQQANRGWPGVLEDHSVRLTPQHLRVCVEPLSRHRLLNESLEVLDGFFEFIVSKNQKGAKGQYFTPRHVVELCVRMLDPKPHETVADPACGSGGFLLHALNHVRPKLTGDQLQRYCSSKLWGFDLDGRALRIANALTILASDSQANFFRLNSLLRPTSTDLFSKDEPVLTIEDICRSRLRRHKGFDVILTNPPFAGEVRERHILDAYELSATARIERDVLFVERCVELLRPGGRMAIVLPHNKFAAETFSPLRAWLLKHVRVLAIVGLGRNTFLPHTHQKASILFAQKPLEKEKRDEDYEILFSVSERDGKNSRGQFVDRNPLAEHLWDRIDHDLGEIEETFRKFGRKLLLEF